MDKIRELIKTICNNDIDDVSLKYFADYFYVVQKRNILPKNTNLKDYMTMALKYKKIVFYDETYPIYKELGADVKGLRNDDDNTLYIRKNLPQPLKDMVVYHEIHHAAQTNSKNNQTGINQESNIGRMIMESQTQYFAEEVYKEINGVEFNEESIASENMRMIPGGTIVSNLHNYQMYDTFLSKLAIILGVDKNYFVTINYLGEDNIGLNFLRQKYEEVKQEKKLSWTFDNLIYNLDYIYCVDLMTYKSNPQKELLLAGNETLYSFEIHPGKKDTLSLRKEFAIIDAFDRSYLIDLLDQGLDDDIAKFSTYIVRNETRDILKELPDNNKKSGDKK